jgi:O-antigen/teichoic acid export membrane protein
MGAEQATAYARARDPKLGPTLLSTWTLLVIPLSIVATVTIELALPILVHAQSTHVLFLARLFAPSVGLAILCQLMNGALLGSHDYRTYNIARLLQWVVLTTAVGALYVSRTLTIETALAANILSLATPVSVAVWRIISRLDGYGRPSWSVTKPSFLYGIKAHGSNFGLVVNARLDLLIMPAFLGATSVGLYSVGTNISWIIVVAAGAIAPLILPAAAAQGVDGHKTVIKATKATFTIGLVMGICMSLVARPMLSIIYGHRFQAGADALILLLPGCILFACAQVLWSGLNASNRPLRSAITQVPGVLITVVGLLVFLRRYGIDAAAIVSSLAYSGVFLCALLMYANTTKSTLLDFVLTPADLINFNRIFWHALRPTKFISFQSQLTFLVTRPRRRKAKRAKAFLGWLLIFLGAVLLGFVISQLPGDGPVFLVIGIATIFALVGSAAVGRRQLSKSRPHYLNTLQNDRSQRIVRPARHISTKLFFAGMATITFLPLRIASLPISDIFFLSSLLVGITSARPGTRFVRLPSGVLVGLCLFTGGGLVASVFSSTSPTSSLLALFQFVFTTGLWFYTAAFVLQTQRDVTDAVRWWIISAAICGLWGVGQKIGLLSGIQAGNAGRVAGLAEQVNNLGGACAVAIVPAIALIWLAKSPLNRALAISLLVMSGAGLAVSGSISGAAAALCGLVVGLFAKELTRAITFTICAAVIVFAVIGLTGQLEGNQLTRFSTTVNPNAQNGQDTFYSRIDVITRAWNQHIKQDPLIGVGLDTKSNLIYSEVSHERHQVHNLFIGDWYEVGLLGLLGILLIISSVTRAGWLVVKESELRDDQLVALALLGSLISLIVFSMGEPIRDQRFVFVPTCMIVAMNALRFARKRQYSSTPVDVGLAASPLRVLPNVPIM